jgi:hypothetical protein
MSQSQKDFSKNVNNCEPGLIACFIGFEAGLSLEFGLNMGKRVHTPIGVRGAVYPGEAVYPHKAPSGSREKPAAVYDTVWLWITVSVDITV